MTTLALRVSVFLLAAGLLSSAWGLAPRVALWRAGSAPMLAALDGGRLHFARMQPTGVQDAGAMPAAGVTTLAALDGQLYAARGKRLQRLAWQMKRWRTVGVLPMPIREILPAAHGLYLLTGWAGVVPAHGVVWWVHMRPFACRRVVGVKDDFRPWRLWWAGDRLAVATYKRTKYAPFLHNCLFLFDVRGAATQPHWLGSRLSRPYVDAAHADLRGDGVIRLAAVEKAEAGGLGLSVYTLIQFGYQREWKTEAIPGLERVAAYAGQTLLAFGHDAQSRPLAWRVLPDGDGYRLYPLPVTPPAPEAATLVYNQTGASLDGWWDGQWRQLFISPSPAHNPTFTTPR